MKEFSIKQYDAKRPIIIYGAGVFGEYTLRALQRHGVAPLCFCDRAKSGGTYLGHPVYDHRTILETKDPYVLLAVGAAFTEAESYLRERGITEIYSIYDLCFADTELTLDELSQQARDIEYYRELYRFGGSYSESSSAFNLFAIDWVITERCSLRCRDCSNLMQYYHAPCNYPFEELIGELERLLDVVDGIEDVRVIGGEPFMNPEMPALMRHFLEHPKIRNFSIYTNASILPSTEMLEVLRNKKVKCEISDYGSLVKRFGEFVSLMEQYGVRHHVVKMDKWHKLGALKKRDLNEEQMKKVFAECYCNDLFTMLHGKIYRCPYSAHGRNLGAIPEMDGDAVDLSEDIPQVREKLKRLLFQKEFDYACGYCSGRNYHLASVEPAIQAPKPLDYEKWMEGKTK